MPFFPRLLLVQQRALAYPLGQHLVEEFRKQNVKITLYDRRLPVSLTEDFRQGFLSAKRTLVVSVWSRREFQTCKPSAHYQLPLVSGCPGLCEYCYLNTRLGKRPFIKVYVNVEDIFARASEYIRQQQFQTTVFEGSATSDPVAVEPWTGLLKQTILFFAGQKKASFRFVTKYPDIEGLLGLEHQGKTEVRFSINSEAIIAKFERGTPQLQLRLDAANQIAAAGYPLGFLIGPIFTEGNWREDYSKLLDTLRDFLSVDIPISFELITHRFTPKAKEVIQTVYPRTEVPMQEERRQYKYGQFGYGKYVYPQEIMAELKDFFQTAIRERFPYAHILYFV